jgi:hypothetical protein
MQLSFPHVVNIVYSCFVIMYCCNLICYLYTIVLKKVTRNKDISTACELFWWRRKGKTLRTIFLFIEKIICDWKNNCIYNNVQPKECESSHLASYICTMWFDTSYLLVYLRYKLVVFKENSTEFCQKIVKKSKI